MDGSRNRRVCCWPLLLAALTVLGPWRALGGPEPSRPAALVVVSDDNYPPYIFRDASGKVRGIVPDQWAIWEARTGVKVDLQAMDWSEAQRRMREGRADVLDTVFLTDERAKLYAFTPPYARIRVPVFVQRDLGGIGDIPSLKGFTIGVKEGDAVIDHLKERGIDSLKQYPSYDAVILAAKRLEIKVFSVDEPAAVYLLYKHGIAAEFRQSFVLYTGEFHRAVQKDRRDLLRLVQDGFDRVSPREYRAIDRRWMGTPFSLKESLRQWGHWVLAGLAIFLALLAGNVLLGHCVYARTAELRATLEDLKQSLSAREASEAAVRESERKYRMLTESMKDVVWTLDVEAERFLYVSPSVERLRGLTAAEVMAGTVADSVVPEEAETLLATLRERAAAFRRGEITSDTFATLELRQPCKGGGTVASEALCRFWLNEQTGRLELHGTTRDITERQRADAERSALQAQLMHAQKLESIGRLAGGVAHDFNNMLQAVLGYAEMALEQVPPGQPLRDDLIEIQKAAQRSTSLARQLQAFARKQAVAPTVLSINEAVEGMSGMLRRLIGESIHLQWRPAPDLWTVMMDPGQLDQIVVNLCVNARDAIGASGHITIETANVAIAAAQAPRVDGIGPGDFVQLLIRDDDCGMSPEIRSRLFEPFFTTKPVGKGTGLGLATVYGIVRQNGGGIDVDSEPGQGTTFRIYLPRCDEEGAAPKAAAGNGAPAPAARGTVLLVEDDESILGAARRMIESLGYQVLAAASPTAAVRLFEEHLDRIDLLITDVVMPEMNGPEMVKLLLERRPGLRHLFMSGHASGTLAGQGIPGRCDILIRKPFTMKDLEKKIQEVMARC